MSEVMTAQESIRLDLYNGLQEMLGTDRATSSELKWQRS
jgi:hypothetical protein